VTFEVFMPLQRVYLGELPYSISLLFLPHSVRLLSAYFLGWRSILYLFPVSLLWSVYIKPSDVPFDVVILIAGLIACVGYIGILVAQALKALLFPNAPARKDWVLILAAGAVASLLNTVGHRVILGTEGSLILGYFIGDMSGLFFSLIILIYIFRYFDRPA
jgi:hypothetical protein